jgi:hypothetical protein
MDAESFRHAVDDDATHDNGDAADGVALKIIEVIADSNTRG